MSEAPIRQRKICLNCIHWWRSDDDIDPRLKSAEASGATGSALDPVDGWLGDGRCSHLARSLKIEIDSWDGSVRRVLVPAGFGCILFERAEDSDA